MHIPYVNGRAASRAAIGVGLACLLVACGESSDDENNSSAVVFSENFEDELLDSAGTSLDFQAFSSFTVTGSVDLISTGDFGITCSVGNACLDLDGTGSNDPASILTSQNISIEAGSYRLTFYMGGNQRPSLPICSAADSVSVSMEPFLAESVFTFDSSEALLLRELEFSTESAGQANLQFIHIGPSDECGAILDDIAITKI